MAIGAGHVDVCTRQGEVGIAVIKSRRLPCGRVVADIALLREAGLSVIGIGGAVVIGQVARHASRSQARELPVHMAGSAVDIHVRAGQREIGIAVVKRRSCPSRR
jgi:hypothetical protein